MPSTEGKIPAQAVLSARAEVHAVKVSEALEAYCVAIVAATRRPKQVGDESTNQEPDQTVVDLNAKHGEQKAETSKEGDKLSDAELQATWLRRVQTTPGDFLRLKFAYQAQTKPGNEQKGPTEAKREAP